ncbi:ABC transporter substrate-binding protein [Streptomyces mangrovisoli]|uniref:4,5-dihydroxyphthalate decarboxylase n=1 Tax=Streptomyces mangrovisoli TaxID=1428628 RepID=A0A1J4NRZ7_9ACTN|nr:ABC transporter substrate-binding protein [Streptomyces mangrovisoli]OIJ63934.1 4,5-dihydroxyphthalate decarboxylase [Streptomyces mangrovisoli]
MEKLSTVLGEYAHARDLPAPVTDTATYAIEEIQVRPVIGAYRRMIRDLEFDVCELAPVSYLMARQAGVPLTAIPVFLNRRFHHGDIQCGARSGIRVPRDLEGRRVGVRAYSVSTGVWARGVLTEEYGVDVDKITWVVDDDDHVEGRVPANVERVTDGRSLGELLRAGEIDAAFTGNAGTGRAGAPRSGWTATAEPRPGDADTPYPLFPDAEILAADHYLRTGVYPLHSLIALRADLVARDPALPTVLYTACAEAKRRETAGDPGWTRLPRFARQAALVDGDPVPYGVAANEPSLHALVRYARGQGLLDADSPADPHALFADGDYPDA